MRAFALPSKQPLRASCEPRMRASTLRRVRRSERHGERQRAKLGILAALLLAACVTPAQPSIPEGRALAVRAGDPAPLDGVVLPVDLAAYLAQSETCCRDCRAELAKQGGSISPWFVAVVGVVAVGAGAAAGYWAGRR